MDSTDRKSLARGRRDALKRQGMLTHHKARRFTDQKKAAAKNACRGRVNRED